MTENYTQSELEVSTSPEPLSFIDKLTGIFTEPSKVFENIRINGPKTSDWVIPILISIVISIFTSWIIMSNPDLKVEVDAKQKKATEEQLDKLVKEGKITEQQKEEQLEQMEKSTSGMTMLIIQWIGIIVFSFVIAFLLALIYWLVWVFILKGNGTYNHALSVCGLSIFITILESILFAVLVLLFVKIIPGISLAAVVDAQEGSVTRFILSKINPFTFWWLYVLGAGLSKVYEVNKIKSIISIVLMWLIYVVIAVFVPVLRFGL